MAPKEELLAVGDATELVALVELRDIVFHEIHAVRLEHSDDDEAAEEPDIGVQIKASHSETRIEVRCVLSVVAPDGQYVIDAAAQYEVDRPVEVSSDVMQEFVERVGVMAVYPYLREGLHAAASKLRLEAPVLGLLRAGRVSVSKNDPSDD